MPASKHCPDCGHAIPPDAPEGLCPRCLAGLASGQATRTCAGESFRADAPDIKSLFPEFEVVELIGRGGMGVVYLVRQGELDRLAALKVLDPGLADDEGFRRRFRNEARTLAALNHPNIVTIYDFGERGGLFYFLMEYVDGGDLGRVLHATPLRPKEVLAIVRQICDAVECAHDAGVVHRDLKPGNILLDRQGRVKVADFGVAKLVGATDAGVPGSYIVGTPAYMAPEQRDGSTEVDHRADIYSLGAVFYELLTGNPPDEKLEPPSVRRVEVDVRLDKVVLRALEKQPDLRYQQVSELRTGVERIAQPRKPPVLSFLLGLTAVVMAAAAVWFHQAGRRAPEDPFGPPAWVNSLGMAFRPIPGADVLLATHETRARDWEAFRRSGRAPHREVERSGQGQGPPDPDDPVTIDGLLDAEVFCRWLSQSEWDAGRLPRDQVYRLPTDREWSLAAGLREPEDGDPATLHLADQTQYPWGRELPAPTRAGNYPDTSLRERIPTALVIPSYHDGYAAIAPVQQFAPNPAGFHDLGGNLWEMVTVSLSNEMGAVLFRGGSWFSGSRDGDWRCLLSSFRGQPESVSPYERGFRVVRAPRDPTREPTLLEASADPAAVDDQGFSALHSAAEQGFPRIVEMLLARGANPETKTSDGRTALFCAAMALGDHSGEVVHLLLDRGANVDATDSAKYTALMQAAARGNPAVVGLLLERGADPNAERTGGESRALSLAAAGPRSIQAAAAIRKAQKTFQGDPAALLASEPLGSEEDYARCVELLLAAGAHPGVKDEFGRSALSYAAQFDQVRSLELLLDAGVSPEIVDREALTPLHWAARGEAPGAAELLLDRGATIASPLNPMTPLHEAARQGSRRVAALLLDRGANPNARDGKAATPLHWAVQSRRAAMVRVLVSHGADLEARDFAYATPLLMAMAQPEEEVLRALIEAGANPRARGLDGLRAVDMAKVRQRLDLAGILDPATPNILEEEEQAHE